MTRSSVQFSLRNCINGVVIVLADFCAGAFLPFTPLFFEVVVKVIFSATVIVCVCSEAIRAGFNCHSNINLIFCRKNFGW